MSEKHSSNQRDLWDVTLTKECGRCYETKSIDSFRDAKGRETVRCEKCRRAAPGEWPPRRRCARCKEIKEISEFTGQRRKARGGRHYWTYCRPCNTIMCRQFSHARIASGQATVEYKERYKKKRWEKLLKQYGLDRHTYEEMEKAQNFLCAICGEPETKRYKDVLCRLVVDHDHGTGKVRGLLCRSCNVALGNFKDDPCRLQKAIDYLRRHK